MYVFDFVLIFKVFPSFFGDVDFICNAIKIFILY